MNYPVWDVSVIGSGWVIGITAIIHVLISHFAVGGGLFLVLTEQKAIREGRRDILARLKGHSKFFLVLTGVFGAMTGVGIWFSIGLANPEGTSTLIHNFVFGWAIEWVVFLLELSLAAVYYYTWNRVPDRVHLKLGWWYAGLSFMTLFLINGILTFKLTPGSWLAHAGSGQEPAYFFEAFFNPGFWPSLGLRTLACIALAGVWSLVFFSRIDGRTDGEIKTVLVRWSARWLLPAFLLMPIFLGWYLMQVPGDHRQLLTLGMSTIAPGMYTHVTRMALIVLVTTATISIVVFLLASLFPKELTIGQALSVLALALMATAGSEGVREMLRKPYVVKDFLYSNSTRVADVAEFNKEGYLAKSIWAPVKATSVSFETGKRMFQGQCLSCHTVDGYRSLNVLLKGRDEKSIHGLLTILHQNKPDNPYKLYMPPLVGDSVEVASLAFYLDRSLNGAPVKVASK